MDAISELCRLCHCAITAITSVGSSFRYFCGRRYFLGSCGFRLETEGFTFSFQNFFTEEIELSEAGLLFSAFSLCFTCLQLKATVADSLHQRQVRVSQGEMKSFVGSCVVHFTLSCLSLAVI